jgi:hypothetical protein
LEDGEGIILIFENKKVGRREGAWWCCHPRGEELVVIFFWRVLNLNNSLRTCKIMAHPMEIFG